MSTLPTFVIHDGKRMRVLLPTMLDDDPAYQLQVPKGPVIVARVVECQEYRQRRVLRAEDIVLEFSRGAATVRRARSRKRYPVTLPDIFEFAVRMHTFKSVRAPTAFRSRKRK